MWHVGIHIWDVPPNEIEPNYDEEFKVRSRTIHYLLLLTGPGVTGLQSPQHTNTTSC